MTISHHPTDMTLAAFASGTLDEGRTLVVATHVSTCPDCRRAVRSFERSRGMALEDAQPVSLKPEALQQVLRQISDDGLPEVTAIAEVQGETPSAPMAAYSVGAWRRIAPGLQFRPVAVPPADGTRVFMLKAAPGTRIPITRMPVSNGPACCRARSAISSAATAPAISTRLTIQSSTGRSWKKVSSAFVWWRCKARSS